MMKLLILGPGCLKCRSLAANAEAAAKELGIEYGIEKVTDIQEITKFGVMLTPALAVDGVVKSCGRVLSRGEIKSMIASSGPDSGKEQRK